MMLFRSKLSICFLWRFSFAQFLYLGHRVLSRPIWWELCELPTTWLIHWFVHRLRRIHRSWAKKWSLDSLYQRPDGVWVIQKISNSLNYKWSMNFFVLPFSFLPLLANRQRHFFTRHWKFTSPIIAWSAKHCFGCKTNKSNEQFWNWKFVENSRTSESFGVLSILFLFFSSLWTYQLFAILRFFVSEICRFSFHFCRSIFFFFSFPLIHFLFSNRMRLHSMRTGNGFLSFATRDTKV